MEVNNNVSYVKVFNQVVDEFFRELIEIFPEEKKIKVRYSLFQTICKTNVRKTCHDFMYGSVNYLEKIAMKDGTLFTGKDKPSLLDELNFDYLWNSGISDNTKEVVWKYIKTFFTIGIKVIEMPPETHGIIKYIIEN